MKVHKVVLVFVDHDGIGAEEAKAVLENNRYPNRCMSPEVLEVQTVDVGEWDDDHPLNKVDPEMKAWKALFAAPQAQEGAAGEGAADILRDLLAWMRGRPDGKRDGHAIYKVQCILDKLVAREPKEGGAACK